MIEDRSVQIRVGIFVMAGCILSAIIIFMLGSERSWFQRKYELRCRFDDISGLTNGASVNLAGVKIGAVSAVLFPQSLTEKQIEVVLKIGREFQDRIRKDSVAAIHTQGLLGDKFINITMGSAAEEAIPAGTYLTVGKVSGIASLAQRGEEVLDEVQNAASLVKDLIGNRSKESIVQTLFYDARGKEIMGDLAQSMRSLQRVTGRFDGDAGLLTHLQRAAEDLRAITAQIRRGEGTMGGLLTDAAIYNDLRSLFGRANRSFLLKTIVRATLRENDKEVVGP